jgi:hypothetical protein
MGRKALGRQEKWTLVKEANRQTGAALARGFGTGVLWGGLLAVGGLVILSQLAPPVPEPGPVVAESTLAEADAVAEKAAADRAAEKAAADAVAEKAAADRAAEKAAADAVAEKAAADRAAEKAAADAVAEKAAADRAAEKAAADAVAEKVAADRAAEKAAADAVAEKVAADRAAEKAAADKAAADIAAAEKAAADKLLVETAARHKAATEQPPAAVPLDPVPPEISATAPDAPTAVEAVALPKAPAGTEEAPSLTGLDQALTVPPEEPPPASAEPAPDRPEGPGDQLLVPGQPPGQTEPARLPQIAPVADPEVAAVVPEAVPEPQTEVAPATSPASTLQDDQPTLPAVKPLEDKLPTTVMDKAVAGVKVGSLPQIGGEAPVEADVPPVRRYARAFEPEGKPLFVILLHDVGSAGMDRVELAKLPFPVSFVVDPLATDAREASAAYRAAGQEVLTLANGIPAGATAVDLETTFGTLTSILPESVAVIDQDIGGFQDQRPLATLVLPVIKGEGRGLVTYDRGLNAADQIARREGVPAAVIFRRLDAEGESKQTIRRYLDRAAFKAAQEGAVVVIGDTRADTVATILEWTVEGRAATVTLAPVTAVMAR